MRPREVTTTSLSTSSLLTLLFECIHQVHKAVADTLFAYRRHCAQAANPGQLILPEALKLLPLYCLALTKFPAFRCLRALMSTWYANIVQHA
jgi:Sec23/Sec24 helical domain